VLYYLDAVIVIYAELPGYNSRRTTLILAEVSILRRRAIIVSNLGDILGQKQRYAEAERQFLTTGHRLSVRRARAAAPIDPR